MERPIGYPEALRVLGSWLGKRVHIQVRDRHGVKLTSIDGVLIDQSTKDRKVFRCRRAGRPKRDGARCARGTISLHTRRWEIDRRHGPRNDRDVQVR